MSQPYQRGKNKNVNQLDTSSYNSSSAFTYHSIVEDNKPSENDEVNEVLLPKFILLLLLIYK